MTRVRWIVLGVVLLILPGIGVLFWFNMSLTSVSLEEGGAHRTWTIQLGDRRRSTPMTVRPDDRYRCDLDGSSYGVQRNSCAWEGQLVRAPSTVSNAEDGTVRALQVC